MKNEQQSVKKTSFLEKLYEVILCCYIVIVPIINSWNELQMLGYAVHISVIVSLLLIKATLSLPMRSSSRNKIGVPIVVSSVFIAEVAFRAIKGYMPEIGLVLLLLLYVAFLCTPKNISMKKVYLAFYISAIIATVYSFLGGVDSAGVLRTATLVDGSIAVVVLPIAFWGAEPFEKTAVYNFMKCLAVVSSVVVVAFGMSRARVAMVALIILIQLLMIVKNALKSGSINTSYAIFIFAVVLILMYIWPLNTTQQLIESISERFEDGFQSLGRTDEIEVGWRYFLDNPVIGRGWYTFKYRDYLGYVSTYYNHCMYVAILARGGILMGLAFLISYVSIFRNILLSRNFYCVAVFLILLALGYGNAGIFNYTICSMIIPLMLNIQYRISEQGKQPVSI